MTRRPGRSCPTTRGADSHTHRSGWATDRVRTAGLPRPPDREPAELSTGATNRANAHRYRPFTESVSLAVRTIRLREPTLEPVRDSCHIDAMNLVKVT